MAGSPDFIAPLRGTEDIPTYRIGGMGLTLGSQMPARIVKPYVYRGLGYDLFPETAEEGPPKPRPDPKAKTWKHTLHPTRRKPKPRPKPYVYVPPPPPPRVKKRQGGVQGYTHRSVQPRPRVLRPAAGWTPMKGSDIDELLEGL